MSPILSSPHIWKSTKIINSDICSLWLAANLCQNVYLTASTPFTKVIYNFDLPLCLFGAFSQSYLKCYLWGYCPYFVPKRIEIYAFVVAVLVAQLCLFVTSRLYSPLESSVHGILQARIMEWVTSPFSRGSSWPRDWTLVSCIAGRFFTIWATREAQNTLPCVK